MSRNHALSTRLFPPLLGRGEHKRVRMRFILTLPVAGTLNTALLSQYYERHSHSVPRLSPCYYSIINNAYIKINYGNSILNYDTD